MERKGQGKKSKKQIKIPNQAEETKKEAEKEPDVEEPEEV